MIDSKAMQGIPRKCSEAQRGGDMDRNTSSRARRSGKAPTVPVSIGEEVRRG